MNNCQMLQDTKRDLETQNKELNLRIESTDNELDFMKNQLREFKETNKGLDSTKFAQEKSLTEYMLKNQNL